MREFASTTDCTDPWLYLPPIAITSLLWCSSPNEVTGIQAVCAFCILLFGWYSYQMWKHRKNETLPLFAMIAGAHWIYFGLPLFGASVRLQRAGVKSS